MPRSIVAVLAPFALLLGAVGCSKEIGDACIVSSDCDPDGTNQRICDLASPSGYCTLQGCDYSTCPDEAVCVRFFTGNFSNVTCDPTADPGTTGCSLDEICALVGHCVPRSSEVRFCMKKCDSNSDCRSGYECRTYDKMVAHGGEDILDPNANVDPQHWPGFCAAVPSVEDVDANPN